MLFFPILNKIYSFLSKIRICHDIIIDSHCFRVNEDAPKATHPPNSQVRGQRSRGERGCKIAPFPGTEAIKRNGNEGQEGECQLDRHRRFTGCKGATGLKEKMKKKKRRQLSNFHLCSPGSSCFGGASNGMEK